LHGGDLACDFFLDGLGRATELWVTGYDQKMRCVAPALRGR